MKASNFIYVIILFFILANIASAGENGIIRVETESGLPVPGAHVYNYGIELGITGPGGILSIPIEELGGIAAITACWRGQCKGGDTHGGGEYFVLQYSSNPWVVKISDGCGFHSPESLKNSKFLKDITLVTGLSLGSSIPPLIESCPEETTDSGPNVPTSLSQFKLDGSSISGGAQIADRSVAFKAKVSSLNGGKLILQVELRRLDEYGGQFDETKGGLKESEKVDSNKEATAYAYGLINGYYHWRARVIDENGKTSDWVDFRNNQGADFIVFSNIVEPPNKSLDLDLTIRDGSTTNGQTLPGVRVTGHDGAGKSFTQITNSNGLTAIKGSPGTWHFEASKDGYQTNTWDQEITAGDEPINAFLVKNYEIPPPKSDNLMLYLTVHDRSIYGQTLPGVRVTGHDGAGKSFTQITYQNGIVVLKGSPGTWHFEASKDGYQTNTWDQELISSANRDAFLVKITERPPPKIEDVDLYLTVHDGSIYGQTLPGVRVTGHDGAGKSFTQITRSGPIDGIVVLRGSPGTWHFEASKDGYQTNTWDQELISSANRDAFLVKGQIQVGCHEDPLTGQVICSDDASVFSEVSSSGTEQITGTTFNKGDRVRTTSDDRLNVRNGPGTNFPSIGTMVKGSTGIIIDGPVFSGNLYWWKVEYDSGITGWSSGKWLELAPQTQIGCHKDPVTGQVKCSDDISVFSNEPIAQPLSDDAATYATYCANQGYNYQNGQCIFLDGTSCDAGAFYRRECEYYSPQSNNEPFQPQPGCMRDPVTGQMICMDDFRTVSQQELAPEPVLGPIPAVPPI